MNWKRIVGWSVLLMVLANGVGILSGVIMSYSEIDPATIDRTVQNSRLLRRIAIGIIAVLCYWRLGVGSPRYRPAHVFAAFLLVQLMDMGLSLLLGGQISEFFEPWAILRSCLYALAGYFLARLSSGSSFKPRPLRGSA